MRLKGKNAIVTGAGAGIGRATAIRFAEEGARVMVAEMDEASGRETAEAIRRAGGAASYCRTDVSDAAAVERMVEAAAEIGPVNVLVNNAAAFVFGRIEEVSAEDWARVLGVNVLGYTHTVRAVLPHLRAAGGGAIVNVASQSGFVAQPGFVPYNTSKGGVMQLTRCLAMDLADDGIRVNGVCPGPIYTQASERHPLSRLRRSLLHYRRPPRHRRGRHHRLTGRRPAARTGRPAFAAAFRGVQGHDPEPVLPLPIHRSSVADSTHASTGSALPIHARCGRIRSSPEETGLCAFLRDAPRHPLHECGACHAPPSCFAVDECNDPLVEGQVGAHAAAGKAEQGNRDERRPDVGRYVLERGWGNERTPVFLRFDGVIAKRFLGVEQGFIQGRAHGDDPRQVRKRDAVGAAFSVDQRRIASHPGFSRRESRVGPNRQQAGVAGFTLLPE